MGAVSTTAYTSTNAAPVVTDNENPITFAGSGRNLIDSFSVGASGRLDSDNITASGKSTLNILDGGAIAGAFDFSKNSVASVMDLTAKLLQQNSTNTSAFLNQVKTASDDALKFIATNQEGGDLVKKVLIGAGLLGGLYIVFNYSKWGK
jgi:hypothetical protein